LGSCENLEIGRRVDNQEEQQYNKDTLIKGEDHVESKWIYQSKVFSIIRGLLGMGSKEEVWA